VNAVQNARDDFTKDNLGLALKAVNGAAFAVTMPNRRDHVVRFFKLMKIPQERYFVVDAVDRDSLSQNGMIASLIDAGTLSAEWWSTNNSSDGIPWFRTASFSRLAVCLSHVKAQNAFLKSGFDIGFFLEDDVMVDNYWKGRHRGSSLVRAALLNAPGDWEMLWVGYCVQAPGSCGY